MSENVSFAPSGSNRAGLSGLPQRLVQDGVISEDAALSAGISMPLLSRLSNRDLNIIGGDRNVTEVIRRQAKKNFVARTSGGKKR